MGAGGRRGFIRVTHVEVISGGWMGSWRVRFGRSDLRAKRFRLGCRQGAHMHTMCMHMHTRTLRSLIASWCCAGGLARGVRVAGR